MYQVSAQAVTIQVNLEGHNVSYAPCHLHCHCCWLWEFCICRSPSTHSASPNRVDILLTSTLILKNFNKLFIFLLMFFLHLGLQLEGKSL